MFDEPCRQYFTEDKQFVKTYYFTYSSKINLVSKEWPLPLNVFRSRISLQTKMAFAVHSRFPS